ncbi:helix-turn-helix transcriptional regulator [Botrimarina hoheduenensis]|uniref:HTH-type transcriptional activator Btr n=1 Tax=Botrimarina hoheduenensis TaxID=2528000 RepID=A0A5C5VR74_9BACT|nr:helix-turn-helix domain-containing protein [Botrimarina hoheduenensis]TWT40647.1 HTH-type transcriptional activator Btr [Botrimarina hoheduenensis]
MPDRASPSFFSAAVTSARRFYLDLAPPANTPLVVVCGGYEESQPDYEIVRETFPYYSIELVARGRGELVLRGEQHALRQGTVFSYGPGVSHTITTSRQSRLGKYFVDFVGVEAPHVFAAAGITLGGVGRVGSLPEVVLIFNELIRDGMRGDDFSAELGVALLRCLALRIAANRVTQPSGGGTPYETYLRCVEYIDAHAATLVSQQQAAAECGVSPAYLSRLFKQHGRQSAHQHLTRLRMNLAAELLRETNDQVQAIAGGLGYSDPFHFSRTFKATFGISPRAFRALR